MRRRVLGDAVISLCALLALLLMLVAIDPRVRIQVASAWGGSTSTSVSKDLGEISTVLLSAIQDRGIDLAGDKGVGAGGKVRQDLEGQLGVLL